MWLPRSLTSPDREGKTRTSLRIISVVRETYSQSTRVLKAVFAVHCLRSGGINSDLQASSGLNILFCSHGTLFKFWSNCQHLKIGKFHLKNVDVWFVFWEIRRFGHIEPGFLQVSSQSDQRDYGHLSEVICTCQSVIVPELPCGLIARSDSCHVTQVVSSLQASIQTQKVWGVTSSRPFMETTQTF